MKIKYDGLDLLFFVLAVVGLIMIAVIQGINNCKTGEGENYLYVIPIMGMIGIYFWRRGKEMKTKK